MCFTLLWTVTSRPCVAFSAASLMTAFPFFELILLSYHLWDYRSFKTQEYTWVRYWPSWRMMLSSLGSELSCCNYFSMVLFYNSAICLCSDILSKKWKICKMQKIKNRKNENLWHTKNKKWKKCHSNNLIQFSAMSPFKSFSFRLSSK
jgi:hypothetical protein